MSGGITSLQALNQWVVWRLEYKPGILKPTKIPYNARTGEPASSMAAETWSDYITACNAVTTGRFSGIGFVFSDLDPYFFFDLDGCRDALTGTLTDEAAAIVSVFPGAAWEISQSGEGIHIVGRCDKRLFVDRRNKWSGWLEFYTGKRFMALGPSGWNGNVDIDWTYALLAIVPVRPVDANGVALDDSVERDPRWKGPEDDAALIQKMLANVGGTKAKLGASPTNRQLWEGDPVALGQFFPSSTGKPFDQSQADQSLLNMLAFWTGRDHARMIRLFSMSALGKRDKWTKRAYYRNRSVGNSIRACNNVYHETTRDERRERQKEENQAIGDAFNTDELYAPNLTLDQMYERFFYVHGVDGIIDSATFTPFKVVAAERTFAGSVTMIPGPVDVITGEPKMKRVSNLALWMTEADGRSKKIVESITWKPNAGLITDVPETHKRGFNMWRGFRVPPGLPTNYGDWLEAWRVHLDYLVPVVSERERFEQWLAHMIQRPQELPHTAYLMFTEQTGIGRNWLSSVLVRVLRGYVASGVDVGKILDGSFNGRLSQKLLAVVDEVRAGMDERRYNRSEKLKSVINEESRQIDTKHGLQTVEWNCMRWLFFSNHPDALPFDNNDRRLVVIANPTVRGGVNYYTWLYGVLQEPAFVASVWQHLSTLDISSFNPGEHAPMNAAKQAALKSMSGLLDEMLSAFVDACPNDLATVGQIKAFLTMSGMGQDVPKDTVLRHALKRSKIIQTGKQAKINGKLESIVILRSWQLNELVNPENGFWLINSENIEKLCLGTIKRA